MLKELQSHPFGKPALVFGLGVIAVLLFILWGKQRRNQGLTDLETLQRRILFSQSGPVIPSAAMRDALQQNNQWLAERNAALDARLFPAADHPKISEFVGNSTAAYFELAGFVESAYHNFNLSSIVLPEKYRFGFSQFEQQGPAPEILSAVMIQKALAEMLLEPLLQAKPVALVALKREFLQKEPESQTVLQQAAGIRRTDQIKYADTIEKRNKLDDFSSYAFEIEFEGYTESLRRFLKGIISLPLPVVVTRLEVQPLNRFGPEEAQSGSGLSNNPFDTLSTTGDLAIVDGPVPIIRNNLSAFKLELEVFCEAEAAPGI